MLWAFFTSLHKCVVIVGSLLMGTFVSLQNVPFQDTNRSLGFLGWGWVCWLNIFPLPVPHTAGVFLLEINLLLPAQLYISFTAPSTLLIAQERKDLVSLSTSWLFWQRELIQKRLLAWWKNSQGLSTLCLCPGLVDQLGNPSLTCMAASPRFCWIVSWTVYRSCVQLLSVVRWRK